MRSTYRNRRASVGFNMTPMIDVVFLLIIFFLVSSNLVRNETQVELKLPEAVSAEPLQQDKKPSRLIVINIPDENRMLIGARPIEPGRLAAILRYEMQRSSEPIELRIRTDARVPYRAIEPILLSAARTGIWDVSFAVTPSAAGR